MATVTIPEPLHDVLRRRAEESGTSIDALVVSAIEEKYGEGKGGKYVTGPFITEKGERGPLYPQDKTPHDLILPRCECMPGAQ